MIGALIGRADREEDRRQMEAERAESRLRLEAERVAARRRQEEERAESVGLITSLEQQVPAPSVWHSRVATKAQMAFGRIMLTRFHCCPLQLRESVDSQAAAEAATTAAATAAVEKAAKLSMEAEVAAARVEDARGSIASFATGHT